MQKTRFPAAALLLICGVNAAAAQAPPYPLWDGRESVASYAARVNLAPEKTIDLGNGAKLELVLIPAGRFIMGTAEPKPPEITVQSAQVYIGAGAGLALVLLAILIFRKRPGRRFSFSLRWLMALCLACSVMVWGGTRWHLALKQIQEFEAAKARYAQANDNEKPGHKVTISKPFYMGKYAVTQVQYQAGAGNNPSYVIGAKNPVETVSWSDAVAFCEKVKSKVGEKLRLPTEAEWEYACRAGTVTDFNTGDTLGKDQANFDSGGPTRVGSFKPNAFGLYDMHGNVSEWCNDWYGADYYKNGDGINPQGPASGEAHVLRGSNWGNLPKGCRSACRYSDTPTQRNSYRNNYIGFRVVVPLD